MFTLYLIVGIIVCLYILLGVYSIRIYVLTFYFFERIIFMLLCKNVVVNGRRTSMRLDKETWNALFDICRRENITLHKLCSRIDSAKGNGGLSSSTRLFVLLYYRLSLAKYEGVVRSFEQTTPDFRIEQILPLIRQL